MSTLSLLPTSLLESLGLEILQKAADAAFGPGVLTLSDDSNGINLGLKLSGGQTVNIDDLTINSDGLSGRLFLEGLDAKPLSATLFDGFSIALTAFDLTLVKSALAASHVAAQFTIPFFTDKNGDPKTVDVELGLKADGSLSITLAAVESKQSTTADGLVQLIYELPGTVGSVEIDVASLEIDKTVDGIWKIVLSGKLVIETASLSWPSFELRGLGIDSKGHISLEGGWIDLPSQMALDFYGFHVALHKLGFGSDSSGKWVGFNGDIHLVEGLSLGGSVRGLRINLDTGAVSLDGVGISFEIADVLTIDGEIDHIHVDATTKKDLSDHGLPQSIFYAIEPVGDPKPGLVKHVDVFAGQVKVVIEAVGGLEVDANFIVGNFGGQSVFFLDIDAELPVGIPIFLDVSLYGLQGLVASGLQPQPEPQHTWWEWYKYPTTDTGIDTAASPDYSATEVHKWLAPKTGAFAIGAGATIGTSADDGFTVSAAITLVLMLPGPVISLIGKANILSKRIGGASQDANFEAMATYDGNAGTFDLTIDAKYEIPVVLDLEGTAELYVGGGEWFFALGKPPHDKRVKARIFDLFESDAYFVVSNKGLITGTWTGYKNSWSFGPLSASIDAYLATLAAIQWSPLQIAGGIELYGNLHLSVFGIGFGLTADALLEGCAPNPFWIHGEVDVELDLPWPLPNISASISLTWGGDDGTIPPAPLALSHIDATLVDHTDSADKQASDHYVLLAHRDKGFSPDLPIQYDPGKPGILDLKGASLAAWQARVATPSMLPDMIPDNNSAAQMAPVLPQDAHFTLNFAHPTIDDTGAFANRTDWGDPNFPTDADVETPKVPSIVGKDDMSNINPNPPAVQFNIRHRLKDVALFEFDKYSNTWSLVCETPPPAVPNPPIGVTQLSGVWMKGDPSKTDPRQVMTQLKVFPWRLLPGQSWKAIWNNQSPQQTYGSSFSDQGLQFTTNNVDIAQISGINYGGVVPGLLFVPNFSQQNPTVTIRFAQKSVVNSITALIFVHDGEFNFVNAPACTGDGSPLTPTSSSQDATTLAWTLNFSDTGPAIQALTIPISGNDLILYTIEYSTPPVPMAILPEAPGFYALRTITKIDAARVGANNYQTVENGDPIVEFVYFQTASGPGTAEGYPAPPALPVPVGPAPYLQLAKNCNAEQQPSAAFPLAGALGDLHTYAQWSWPLDGALTAYYGYDVNVEFVESYVNALYTAFSNGSVANSLHFRCVDRNNNHTLLVPNAIHVPSIPQESALVATAIAVPIPKPLQSPTIGPIRIGAAEKIALEKKALEADKPDLLPIAAPAWIQSVSSTKPISLLGAGSGLSIQQMDPVTAGGVILQILEDEAAEEAKALWFKPLLPKTRYTLDVVAGPWYRRDRQSISNVGIAPGSLADIYAAKDAIDLLEALKAYLSYEDSLTTLERVQFTTSRYATFSDQLANAIKQLAASPGATPIRRYVAATDPLTWFSSVPSEVNAFSKALLDYINDQKKLANVVSNFDPLADDLQPGPSIAANGAGALVQNRQAVIRDWQLFQKTASALFDGLITALGHPEMASGTKPIAVPDTEISFFTDNNDYFIRAILLESPEPLPWQRIWRWIRLSRSGVPVSTQSTAVLLPLWNGDGTKALLLPLQVLRGSYDLNITFQGNIGAEAPSITQNGNGVSESAAVGSITMGPRRIIIRLDGVEDHPQLHVLREILAPVGLGVLQ